LDEFAVGFKVGLKPKTGFCPVEEIEGNLRVSSDFVEDLAKNGRG